MTDALFQIAIDGPAASGKGTLARTLAMKLSYDYLDTGSLYRAVALASLQAGISTDAVADNIKNIIDLAQNLALPVPDDAALRLPETAQMASKIASSPEVRQALVDKQRDFAMFPPTGKGAVLDGRDIGSVILPDADLKLYIDADVNVRAKRRFLELSVKDEAITHAQVLADLTERDARDKTRTTAPLKPADDAHIIDSSDKSAEDVLQIALKLVKSLNFAEK